VVTPFVEQLLRAAMPASGEAAVEGKLGSVGEPLQGGDEAADVTSDTGRTGYDCVRNIDPDPHPVPSP